MSQGQGNLLPVGDQGFPNGTRWTATGAATNFSSWTVVPTSFKAAQGVRLTASGSTGFSTKLNNAVPVAAGQEYAAWGWFGVSVTRSLTATCTIHWLNAGGTEIGTSTRPRTMSYTAGAIYRASAYGTAPVGTTQAKVSVAFTGVTSDIVYVDFMYLGQPEPGNLLTFPEFTSDYTLAPWITSTGTLTSERGVTLMGDGDTMLGFAPAGTGIHTVTLNRWVPVTGGETYAVKAAVMTLTADPNATAATRVGLEVRNALGATTLITPGPFFQYQGTVGIYVGVFEDRTVTLPADAVDVRVVVQVYQAVSNHADLYYIDAVSVATSLPDYVLAVDDSRGMVSISIYDRPVYAGPNTVSVYRMSEDGSMVPLRGYGREMVDAPYSNEDLFLEDYEAPVGTRVYYRVVWTGNGGQLSQLDTDSVVAPQISDGSYVWVKSPGNPALNTMVMMAENPSWSMAARSAAYAVVGRSAPVVVSETRGSRTGTLAVRLADWDTNDVARELMQSGLPLLMQAAPGHGMDGNVYFAIGDVSYEPENWNATVPGWLWTLDVTEIDRPVGGLQGSAGRTWQDVLDGFESWDEVFAAYGSWLDVQTGG
ncbi:hypothetical protein [Streptomyces sp. NPDC101393]|uniref:hypothetical protein n=1 Tax=Streptomyces sp. NPDC101393 TaxID=3366141 RepID=UPI00380418D2